LRFIEVPRIIFLMNSQTSLVVSWFCISLH